MTPLDLLIDTNIVIYLINTDLKYTTFMEKFIGKRVGVSIVTYMEALIGATIDQYEKDIHQFFEKTEVIPLDVTIAQKCAAWLKESSHRNLRHPHLADIIIGHTALILGIPLVTNNPKDFASFKGLKLITP